MPDHDPSQPDPRLGTEHPDVTVHELPGGESYYTVRDPGTSPNFF